ncbi:hypothetical protein [Bradyrhizobium sp.]|uniref:hypothetical protein n=1 Tax=Bradyrhizobium sp. TaxID=376 RepID=UPI003C553CF4
MAALVCDAYSDFAARGFPMDSGMLALTLSLLVSIGIGIGIMRLMLDGRRADQQADDERG